MIICICNNISDRKIKDTIESNGNKISSIKDLKIHLPLCNQCGKCKSALQDIIEKTTLSN